MLYLFLTWFNCFLLQRLPSIPIGFQWQQKKWQEIIHVNSVWMEIKCEKFESDWEFDSNCMKVLLIWICQLAVPLTNIHYQITRATHWCSWSGQWTTLGTGTSIQPSIIREQTPLVSWLEHTPISLSKSGLIFHFQALLHSYKHKTVYISMGFK